MPNPVGASGRDRDTERVSHDRCLHHPRQPADPEAAALELIVQLPEDILHTTALRPVLP